METQFYTFVCNFISLLYPGMIEAHCFSKNESRCSDFWKNFLLKVLRYFSVPVKRIICFSLTIFVKQDPIFMILIVELQIFWWGIVSSSEGEGQGGPEVGIFGKIPTFGPSCPSPSEKEISVACKLLKMNYGKLDESPWNPPKVPHFIFQVW